MRHIKLFENWLNESDSDINIIFEKATFDSVNVVMKNYWDTISDGWYYEDEEREINQKSIEDFTKKYQGYQASEVEDDGSRKILFDFLNTNPSLFRVVSGRGEASFKVAITKIEDSLVAVHGDENFFLLRKA